MNRDYRDLAGPSANDLNTLDLFDGHIIRFDDTRENAFVFIENDATSEYRWVGCQELGSLGPLEEGQAFILWLKSTDPNNSVSHFFPAVPKSLLSDEELAERNKRVREIIKTLDDLKVEIY